MNLQIHSIYQNVYSKNTFELPSWFHKNVIKDFASINEPIVRTRIPSTSKVHSVKIKKDKICSGTASGAIALYSMDGELLHQFRGPKPNLEPVYYTSFHPKNSNIFYASDASGHVYIMNSDKMSMDTFITECHNEINTFDISKTGKDMITGGKDGVLRDYDTDTGKLKHAFAPPNRKANDSDPLSTLFHKTRIFKILFHPDEINYFLTGGWDDCLKVWDIRTTRGCVLNIPGPKIYGDAIDVRGNLIVTASFEAKYSIKVWDRRTGGLLDIILPLNHHYEIFGEFRKLVAFYKESHIISVYNGRYTIEIISLKNKRITENFVIDSSIYCLDFSEKYIVCGTANEICVVVNPNHNIHNTRRGSLAFETTNKQSINCLF